MWSGIGADSVTASDSASPTWLQRGIGFLRRLTPGSEKSDAMVWVSGEKKCDCAHCLTKELAWLQPGSTERTVGREKSWLANMEKEIMVIG